MGSYQVIVDLISATTTATGLEVPCELDANTYPKGVTVSDAEMAALNVEYAEFHGEWNYTIRPTNRSDRAVDAHLPSHGVMLPRPLAVRPFRTQTTTVLCGL